MSPLYYQINKVDVVHELIEGEAILINMKTGSYYSLQNSGAVVWGLLQGGPVSSVEIAKVFSDMFVGDLSEMQTSAETLLTSLENEGLVQRSQATDAKYDMPEFSEPAPFQVPELQIYTDLEALLLLDPIHDVSGEGWPITNPDEK